MLRPIRELPGIEVAVWLQLVLGMVIIRIFRRAELQPVVAITEREALSPSGTAGGILLGIRLLVETQIAHVSCCNPNWYRYLRFQTPALSIEQLNMKAPIIFQLPLNI